MPVDDPGGVIAAGPDRQTRVIGGEGGSTMSYRLPAGLFQYVESVYVELDTSGASDARPELAIATDNGVVMARKRQGEDVLGGDTGSATWALRLDDERRQPDTALPYGYLVYKRGAPSTVVVPTGAVGKKVLFTSAQASDGVTIHLDGVTGSPDGFDLPVGLWSLTAMAHWGSSSPTYEKTAFFLNMTFVKIGTTGTVDMETFNVLPVGSNGYVNNMTAMYHNVATFPPTQFVGLQVTQNSGVNKDLFYAVLSVVRMVDA